MVSRFVLPRARLSAQENLGVVPPEILAAAELHNRFSLTRFLRIETRVAIFLLRRTIVRRLSSFDRKAQILRVIILPCLGVRLEISQCGGVAVAVARPP